MCILLSSSFVTFHKFTLLCSLDLELILYASEKRKEDLMSDPKVEKTIRRNNSKTKKKNKS